MYNPNRIVRSLGLFGGQADASPTLQSRAGFFWREKSDARPFSAQPTGWRGRWPWRRLPSLPYRRLPNLQGSRIARVVVIAGPHGPRLRELDSEPDHRVATQAPADWAVGDTAGWAACATPTVADAPKKLVPLFFQAAFGILSRLRLVWRVGTSV